MSLLSLFFYISLNTTSDIVIVITNNSTPVIIVVSFSLSIIGLSLTKRKNIIKGENYIFWDGQNDLGKTSTSGIYFINLIQGFETLRTHKVLFLK